MGTMGAMIIPISEIPELFVSNPQPITAREAPFSLPGYDSMYIYFCFALEFFSVTFLLCQVISDIALFFIRILLMIDSTCHH